MLLQWRQPERFPPSAIMPLNWHKLTLDEQSFQSVLSAAFTIQEHNDRRKLARQIPASDDARTDARIDAGSARTEILNGNSVPNHLPRKMVQQALQATHASGAAIALGQEGKLICRAVAGDFGSEIDQMINTGSGFTGVCTSSGTMQLCSNTALDPRVDADTCRKIGVSAIVVAPFLHEDQLLGLIAVFSRRPYAFGMRDLQALQDLAEKFAADLQLSTRSANANTPHESAGRL
jgi:GAF domain-containing protein